MKKTLAVLMVIGVVLGAAIVAAAASDTAARVKIPFAFHAGDQLMPAGEYWIELPRFGNVATGGLLKITSVDFRLCQHLFSQPEGSKTVNNYWHVTFSKVGDQYFLAGAQLGIYGAELYKSSLETTLTRELGTGSGQPAVVHLKAHASRSK